MAESFREMPKAQAVRSWTPSVRKEAFEWCVKANGKACVSVKHDEGRAFRQWDIHHKDGDRTHNPPDGSNWALMCHPCNVRESPHGPPMHDRFSTHLHFKESRTYQRTRERLAVKTLAMQRNVTAEPIVREFAREKIKEKGEVGLEDLIDAAAEEVLRRTKSRCSITQERVRLYLDKMLNPLTGEYEIFEDEDGVEWIRRRQDDSTH